MSRGRGYGAFLSLILLLLSADSCVPASVPEVALTAPDVEIAFSTTQGIEGRWRRGSIFVMAIDGTHQAALAHTRGGEPGGAPTWSPDGECVAFPEILNSEEIAEYGSGVALAILCADRIKFLIPGGRYGTWSPNGKTIVYYGLDRGDRSSSINIIDLETSQIEPLITGLGGRQEYFDALRLSWSPTGEQIVYEMDEPSGKWGIYVMNRDGTQRRFLTRGRRPDWSPTRPEIAFDDEGVLWLIDADGTGRHALTSGGDDQWPSWSPDGEVLIFESHRDGNGEIYRINRDGTGLMRLTDNPAWDGKPAWRPGVFP